MIDTGASGSVETAALWGCTWGCSAGSWLVPCCALSSCSSRCGISACARRTVVAPNSITHKKNSGPAKSSYLDRYVEGQLVAQHILPREGTRAVVLGVERRGRHRAGQRASTLAHDAGRGPFQGFPAPCGPSLPPLAGCGGVRQEKLGAGRCLRALAPRSQRTREGLMAHHERPIDDWHGSPMPPRTSRDLLMVYRPHIIRRV